MPYNPDFNKKNIWEYNMKKYRFYNHIRLIFFVKVVILFQLAIEENGEVISVLSRDTYGNWYKEDFTLFEKHSLFFLFLCQNQDGNSRHHVWAMFPVFKEHPRFTDKCFFSNFFVNKYCFSFFFRSNNIVFLFYNIKRSLFPIGWRIHA